MIDRYLNTRAACLMLATALLLVLQPSVHAEACDIVGTSGPDVLVGTPRDDVICGLGGDDTISGRGGDDRLAGGTGA
ncbi:MAG TPA: hypothetical protein VG929_09820, partial [Actinomycetota bacterium]|nr:hypothetical protein [Actinomycetota bacterium]